MTEDKPFWTETAALSALSQLSLQQQIQWYQNELDHTQKQLQITGQQRERSQAALQQRTRQVRLLATELILVEQRLRQEIAQALHDDLQQHLFATQVHVQFVGQTLRARDELSLWDEVQQIKVMLDEALRLTRRLTLDMSPAMLQGHDLLDVLNGLVEHVKELHGLEVVLQLERPGQPVDEAVQQLLFQIVRELLFNVVKHADVSQARVELGWEEPQLVLKVQDGGNGFEARPGSQDGAAAAGFGLKSIKERVALFEGHVDITSAPGQGTLVTVMLPLENAAA